MRCTNTKKPDYDQKTFFMIKLIINTSKKLDFPAFTSNLGYAYKLNIKDEKAETLKDALMILLSHYKTMKTVQIRVDNQSGFYSLKDDKTLEKLNIQIIPGDSKNVNKNPVAERAVREIGDEILKIQSSDKEITTSILAQATMAVNNKIRYRIYSK